MDPLHRWHVAPSQNKDYEFIDGLRGIAILLVVCAHLFYVNPSSGWSVRFLGFLLEAGVAGLPLFFALSGFLISWPFWKRKLKNERHPVPPGYARRRFFKIYPPLALSILLFTPIYLARTGDLSYVTLAWKWLAGVPLFFPISGKFNPVMWSLVVEVQFYIVLPLTMLLLRRASFRTCLWLVPLSYFVAGIARSFSLQNLQGVVKIDLSVLNLPFPSHLDAFAIGLFIAGLHCQGSLRKEFVLLGYLGAVLLLCLFPLQALVNMSPVSGWLWAIIQLAVSLACGLLLLFISNPKCVAAVFLSHSLLRWFGLISYEWYLLHQPFIVWARQSFGPAQGSLLKYLALTGGSLLFSLGLAAALYRFYSLPILRRGRQAGK